jgi:hypothetical protein|nr:MAG TPA: hypothetical protein [Caudoviricetes sp.]
MAIKHFYCAPITRVPDRLVFTASVPEGQTIQAGAVLTLEELDVTFGARNVDVYKGAAPTDINTQRFGLVINGGFEQLPDGRRPEGQPDYTQYEFKGGDVVTVVMIDNYVRFEISHDAIKNATATAKNFLIPVQAEYALVNNASHATAKCYLRVETAGEYLRAGGLFGAEFIKTVIATGFIGDDVA